MKKILIVDTHPRASSFGEALATSYEKGARELNDVKRINLRDLTFNPNLTQPWANLEEEDIIVCKELVKWCDHMVLVGPIHWGSFSALYTVFFNKVFTTGFAYGYKEKGIVKSFGMLQPRTATAIYTQGTPKWISKLVLIDSIWRILKMGHLYFCGFRKVKRFYFGPEIYKNNETRDKILKKIEKAGHNGA